MTTTVERKWWKTGVYSCYITLVYKIFLKNALYLVFDWFPLILGRWFRIRSPFLAVWSEFCSVASFVFFGLENQIFEIFENLANFFLKISNIFLKTIKLWTICKKNFWNRPIGSGDIACQSSKKRQNLKIFEIFRKIFRHKNFFKRKFEKKIIGSYTFFPVEVEKNYRYSVRPPV